MARRPNSVLLPLAGAMGASLVAFTAACAPLGLGPRVVEPSPPAPVDTTPTRPAWEAPAPAATARSDEAGLARLARLAETWHAVRWFHPLVVDRPGVWDTAYLRHVDRARTARSDAAFAQAVQAMLGELFDASTRVVVDTLSRPLEGAARAAVLTTDDGLVLARPVTMAGGDVSSLADGVPRTAAVLDLRADSGQVAGVRWQARLPQLGELLPPGEPVRLPVRRHVRRSGPDAPDVRASYQGAPAFTWVVRSAPPVMPARDADSADARPRPPATRAGHQPPRVVVLVNDGTVVPAALFALHARGEVAFVSTGGGALHDDARVAHVALGGGFFARVRLEELLTDDGRAVATRADTVLVTDAASALTPDTTDAAVALALAVARGTVALRPRVPTPSRLAVAPPPTSSRAGDAPYPSHPERLLAVTQLWGTVRAFDPYLPMADETWDDAFTAALGDVEAAATARAYATALLRFTGTLDATQVTVELPDHPETWRRAGTVPFTLRLVDGAPVVTAIDDTAAQRSGVRVGDEIVAIGGEPIDKRFERLRPLVAASNEWSREARLRAWLEQGPALVKATYRVRSAAERGTSAPPRDVEFQYGETGVRVAPTPRRQVDSLPGGVARVTLGAADSPLPSWVAGAAGVIVDARGARDGLSLSWLAGSVLDADGVAFARDERSTLEAPPTAPLRAPELDPARATTRTVRTAPRAPRDAFTGPMAVLVDATTQGEGELIALRLLAGGLSRVLVGTPTAGAVGDVATLRLPGQVQVTFPVHEVRHPDGAFVQRLGLTPSLAVTPTVTAVRNGRDEALEAAQRWIAQQLAPPPGRRR